MLIPDSLIQALARGHIVPFVGSGVSLSVRRGLFPTWPELLNHLADRLEADAKPNPAEVVRLFVKMDQLTKAADEAIDGLGKAGFATVMREQFQLDPPADVDLSLVHSLWRLEPRLLLTTNYDDVLQWANPASTSVTNSQKAELAELFTLPTSDKPWVWHVHGHVRDADSLILAPRQYDRLYRDAADEKHPYAAAWQQLRNVVTNFPLLFVGFGLQDRYVMEALDVVLEMFGRYLRPGYALVKSGEPKADEMWQRHNIQAIEFDDYGEPLSQLVDEMVRQMNAISAPGTDKGTAPPMVPSTYVDWLQSQFARVELLGLQAKRGLRATLSNVYVPLTTGPGDAETSNREALDTRTGIMRAAGHEERHGLLLDLLGESSLYVSGPPGAGKSTFCRWVALLSSAPEMPTHPIAPPEGFREAPNDELRGRLPLLLPLREFWDWLPKTPGCDSLTCGEFERSLQAWIEHKEFDGVTWRLVGQHLKHGSVLAIFDGVDEVPLTAGDSSGAYRPRSMLLAGLSEAVKHWTAAGNRVLVTSRPYGLSDADRQQLGLQHAAISDLPRPLQQLLVRRWFHCLAEDPAEADKLADEMLTHVAGRPEITPLAANPLMLTAICIIFHEGGRLPQDKYDLYKRITSTVLGNRYGDEVATVRGYLCAVAYGMHTGHGLDVDRATPGAEATLDEVDRIIRGFRKETAGTERGYVGAVRTRDDLLTRSGILESRGHDRAAFYHLSFQEFLAGERFLDLAADRLFSSFLQRTSYSEWRNTLSFVFAALIDKSSSPDRAARLLSALIARLTDDQPASEASAGSEATGGAKPAGLATVIADCLEILWGRGSGLNETEERAYRDYCLTAIMQEAPLGERFELGMALGKIGDPRVPVDLHDHQNDLAWVKIPEGDYFYGDEKETFRVEQPFLITRFPVTNAQFRLFLEKGGYENRDLWSDDGWNWRTKQEIREPGYWRDPKWNGPTQPVVRVSWYEADAFCRWVGGRLPGEREWEAAARGPDGLVYPWGDDWEDGICNNSDADLGVTSPVGLFPRSRSAAFGLEDMAGNVWEWCENRYDEDRDSRVLRGGSWGNGSRLCRAAIRGRSPSR